MQARRQDEVAAAQGAGRLEFVEDVLLVHGALHSASAGVATGGGWSSRRYPIEFGPIRRVSVT